MTSSGL